MGRPKMQDEKKKIQMSVSLSKTVAGLAESTGNSSHFLDTSVQSIRAISLALKRLQEKQITLETAMELFEDAADIWEAEFDATEDYR